MPYVTLQNVSNASTSGARERRLKRYCILFWSLQAVLFIGALVIRLAAPATILTPMQTLQPMPVIPSNVCALVNGKIVTISRTPRSNLPALTERVADLGSYLQVIQSRLPAVPDERYTPDFIVNIRSLRQVCSRWQRSALTPALAADMQAELIAYRNRFNQVMLRIPKPAPLWYIHTVRGASGFLEGLAAAALLPWRAVSGLLSGGLSLRTLLHPSDWRRTGPFFVALLFYSGMLSTYLFAWLAQRYRQQAFYIPSLFSVVYGTCHVVYHIAAYF